MLFSRPNGGTPDWVGAMGYGLDFNDRQRVFGRAGIAGEFRHCLAGIGILIFAQPYIGQEFAFNHDLGVSNGFFIDGFALNHFNGVAAQGARNT